MDKRQCHTWAPLFHLIISHLFMSLCIEEIEFQNKLKTIANGSEYLRGLEKTRSAVAKIGAATYQSLSKGDSKLTEAGLKQLDERQLGELRFFLAVGRACKYGIDYVLT